MMDDQKSASIVLNLIQSALLATVQVPLQPKVLERFQTDLLDFIDLHTVQHILLDFSGLDLMDKHEFIAMLKILDMASLMGAKAILVGLKAGVVASLVQENLDLGQLKTALDIDEALAQISHNTK